ncbi:Efflux pump azaK [Colletotrichum orbiculare MAFF 240422]|uniref:Efflux pump azaK n=1 Tax=Colletotrichum orbiculare (strain 104-T / ATCC 96160 / CBS 514.97 / LARS 414 / MAFF 240422) TaxID=1213857 RepID=N4V503_COLOR|nr:Efflux pump azaK [Colletotrichum orbiculare MAFF 240422]
MAPNITAISATEATPLLATRDIAPTADAEISKATTLNEPEPSSQDADKPLPKWQIILLCYARLVEPMAFFSIVPYINQMVQENGGLSKTDVGFYSGLIESLFSLTQAVVMIFWGKISDRVGRKAVLVFSLFGVALATSIFGMAQTIWQMILFRCVAGIFAGTIVTMRTMIAEHSTPKTQARAFSWFAFSGNMGLLFGPLLGGALADPVSQYPRAFRGIRFFEDYPYALSSFVVGFVGLTAALSTLFFVEETLKRDASHAEGDGLGRPKHEDRSVRELVKAPGVGIVLYTYGHVMLLAIAYTAIVPVFWYTPVDLGGYGFEYLQISLMMAVNGIAQAFWLLVVFPPLQHRWGTNGVMRACAYAYPWFFVVGPVGNLLLKAGGHNPAAVTLFWIFTPVALAMGSGVSMSFTGIQLALNDVSPNPQVLGTLNALALTGVCVIRSFTPATFTSLFAIGARTQALGGYAIWLLMALVAVPYIFAVRRLPEAEDLQKARTSRDVE